MTGGLTTQGLVKRYGALLVTDQVSLDIIPGEIHAVIGPNGAGKTTLINQISGELQSNEGTIKFGAHDITAWAVHERARAGLLRSYQITSIFEQFTVLENAVLSALGVGGRGMRFWRPMLSDPETTAAAREGLAAVGLGSRADVLAGELGYGERRQLELAMVLAARPTFLLLDEPMAGMSVQESAAVIDLLKQIKGRYTILLVEHDMDAVFALADRISVLVYGRIAFTGTPEEVRNNAEVRAVYLGEESPEGAKA